MQFRYHIGNVKGAILRFARRMLVTKRLTVLMLMGICALMGVVGLYYADARLMVGPWHTYADGLFSVNEPRDEHFEEFRRFSARIGTAWRRVADGGFSKVGGGGKR